MMEIEILRKRSLCWFTGMEKFEVVTATSQEKVLYKTHMLITELLRQILPLLIDLG